MREEFLVFGAPLIEQPEIDEVVDVLKVGWLGTGPRVEAFENSFAQYKGVSHAAAVCSCTAALHLSILAAGIEDKDEVITTPLTFCATVNAICHAGAKPVLADVDSKTMNIDPNEVERKISSRTRAILPVHFGGRSCDMEAINWLAQKHGLKVIEDCAHAIETEFKGQKAGTIGDFGCFSFYVTKNIITGEGGMVLAKREEDLRRIKRLALHGLSADAWKRFSDDGYQHYFAVELGYKYNMMDIQAAIGKNQLERADRYWRRRESMWRMYNEAFLPLPVTLPADPEKNTRHAYHLYTILVDEEKCGISRDRFLVAMKDLNIGVGVHYLSLPEHPFYRKTFGWQEDDYPVARDIGRSTVSLPLSPKLSDQDVTDVITAVTQIIR